jgi:hypothetical protein
MGSFVILGKGRIPNIHRLMTRKRQELQRHALRPARDALAADFPEP